MIGKDISLLMYSHSSYSDVWPLFVGQTEKYLSEIKKYAFVDGKQEMLPADWNIISYDDELSYNRRMAYGLRHINTKYCILHHEDMPLYSAPQMDKLSELVDIMEKEKNVSFIRLIKNTLSGERPFKSYDNLFTVSAHSNLLFVVQPTIWRTDKLFEVYYKTEVNHIREFENESHWTCLAHGIEGLYYYDGAPQKGTYHFDSNIYPYVATAIVKGQWNMSGYPEELGDLGKTYSIDFSKRGTV
jgi:hypothetical protein|tara:strand:- start:723 stop:1451 length:729 start_codon:yes stop_codon:yes gene_type:complete